jgi:hypothetical protein
VPSSIGKQLKDADAATFLRQSSLRNWKRFDTYVRSRNSVCMVKFNAADWKKSSCTCPCFFKCYICKHICGIAIIRDLFTVPLETNNIPIAEQKLRRR